MSTHASSFYRATLLALGALIGTGSALASAPVGTSAQDQYRAERAACESGTTGQARQDCLREAGAALQERQRNRLHSQSERNAVDYRANAAARCARLPPAHREGCLALRGDNVQVQGSVQSGAILRQTTIPDPEARSATTPGSPAAPAMPGSTPSQQVPQTVPAPAYTPRSGHSPAHTIQTGSGMR